MRVLHVTECHAGGVSKAIQTLVQAYPAEHHLLWTGAEHPARDSAYAKAERLPSSHIGRVRAIAKAVRTIQPDVVHAHSSWAGMYSRIAPINVPIVYEPHCFVFDDPGRVLPLRVVYRLVESVLSWRTQVTVVLSPHEQRLAANLRPGNPTAFLPNIASISGPVVRPQTVTKRVVMAGRVAPQKDPAFFAQVARIVRAAQADADFVWVGSGDDAEMLRDLADSGVKVTGWLDEAGVQGALLEASVYLHSASYEAFR